MKRHKLKHNPLDIKMCNREKDIDVLNDLIFMLWCAGVTEVYTFQTCGDGRSEWVQVWGYITRGKDDVG